jgi:hypothetical protein
VNAIEKGTDALYINHDEKDNFDPFRERKLDHPTT